LSWTICREHLPVHGDGTVKVPDAPGLGVSINLDNLRRYVVDLEITAGRNVLYRTPSIDTLP
jgi:hypothetical protein